MFEDVDTDPEHNYIQTTIEKDSGVTDTNDALLEFYRRLRPGEPPNADNAKDLLENLFFNPRRYDLGRVGRYKLNRKLHTEIEDEYQEHTLTREDIVELLRRMVQINNGVREPDDIDHLGNRRVRAVGELIQNQVRVGLIRMERVIKERMTTQMDPRDHHACRSDKHQAGRRFGARVLRRLPSCPSSWTRPTLSPNSPTSAGCLRSGPGGLSRERAGIRRSRRSTTPTTGASVQSRRRKARISDCWGSLATYARTNDYGFIETPYRKVNTEILNTDPDLENRTLTEDVVGEDGHIVLKAGGTPTRRNGRLTQIASLPEQMVNVRPFVSNGPQQRGLSDRRRGGNRTHSAGERRSGRTWTVRREQSRDPEWANKSA